MQSRSYSFSRVDAVLSAACGTLFTGAVARIEHQGRLRFERAYGVTRADRHALPVYVDTRFDLASLTKIFVSTLLLRAVEERRIGLDTPLTAWFPQWSSTQHAGMTARMLLAHNAGMNSGADYRQLLGDEVVAFTLARPLVAALRERVIYSDLGFIALGELLERIYGRSLSSLIRALEIDAQYRPPQTAARTIPATEDDGWRGRVQGFVHDEKAYLLGGVAGHAGIFGTAADVAWLAEQYLGVLHRRGGTMLHDELLVREALSEQAWDPVLRRGLGWALKTSDDNSCGRWLSNDSFGHTGFVGTCVWADPQRDCSGVLLTNSVYFGRRDTRDVRAAFYEALVDDLALR